MLDQIKKFERQQEELQFQVEKGQREKETEMSHLKKEMKSALETQQETHSKELTDLEDKVRELKVQHDMAFLKQKEEYRKEQHTNKRQLELAKSGYSQEEAAMKAEITELKR